MAAGKVILDFFGNTHLKTKRAGLEELLTDLRKSHNVSAVEVADFDDLERAVVGLALAAGTEKGARAAMKTVLEYIDANSPARMVMEDVDVFGYD